MCQEFDELGQECAIQMGEGNVGARRTGDHEDRWLREPLMDGERTAFLMCELHELYDFTEGGEVRGNRRLNVFTNFGFATLLQR